MSLRLIRVATGRVLEDRRGATMVEYALLIALVGTVAATSLTSMGSGIVRVFTSLAGQL